jgi:hypothetical protein
MNNIVQSKPDTPRPVPKYSPYDYLNALPQFNLNEQSDNLIDQARAILDAGNYYHQTVGFPDLPGVVVSGGVVSNYALGETKTGTIQVPAGSFLVSICIYSQNTGGCKVRIFDKGTKAELFDRQYGMSRLLSDNNSLYDASIGPLFGIDQTFSAGNVNDPNLYPWYALSPIIITPPGVLQVDTTNMDLGANGNYIQIVLQFAVPINQSSEQIIVVNEV